MTGLGANTEAITGRNPKYPNLRPPWRKGETGNAAGVPKRVLKLRKQVLSLAPKALEKIQSLIETGDIEGLKLWVQLVKHCTPAATALPGVALELSPTIQIRPELAQRLAAMSEQ